MNDLAFAVIGIVSFTTLPFIVAALIIEIRKEGRLP